VHSIFVIAPSDGCPTTANLLSLDASLAIPTRVLLFEVFGLCRSTPVRPVLLTGETGTHRSDRSDPLVRPVRPTGQTGLELLHLRLRFFGLSFVDQPRKPVFSGEPPETPRTQCSFRQSPLMTRLPRSPGSNLVLRLNQETVHDFILSFLPPCGPHLTPLSIGSLEPSLLVFFTLGGLTGNDLSRLFFTCTNTSQAATYTCNT
jgi:hypothetical protein